MSNLKIANVSGELIEKILDPIKNQVNESINENNEIVRTFNGRIINQENALNTHKNDTGFKHKARNISLEIDGSDLYNVQSIVEYLYSQHFEVVQSFEVLSNLLGVEDENPDTFIPMYPELMRIREVINKFFTEGNIPTTLDELKEIVGYIEDHRTEFDSFFRSVNTQLANLRSDLTLANSSIGNKADSSSVYTKDYIDNNITKKSELSVAINTLNNKINSKQSAYSVHQDRLYGTNLMPITEFGEVLELSSFTDINGVNHNAAQVSVDDNINIVEFGVPDYWVASVSGGIITLYQRESQKQFTQVSETEFETMPKDDNMLYFVIED